MSFLSGLRGLAGKAPDLPEGWKVPDTTERAEEIFELSDRPQVIYKHSYNCATCIFTKMKVEDVLASRKDEADFYFVNVIQNRPVSNLIAERTGVRHESPQVLVILNGEVAWTASHGGISQKELLKAIKI
jgi:bacillithiol system protein YtxJ